MHNAAWESAVRSSLQRSNFVVWILSNGIVVVSRFRFADLSRYIHEWSILQILLGLDPDRIPPANGSTSAIRNWPKMGITGTPPAWLRLWLTRKRGGFYRKWASDRPTAVPISPAQFNLLPRFSRFYRAASRLVARIRRRLAIRRNGPILIIYSRTVRFGRRSAIKGSEKILGRDPASTRCISDHFSNEFIEPCLNTNVEFARSTDGNAKLRSEGWCPFWNIFAHAVIYEVVEIYRVIVKYSRILGDNSSY